MIDPVDIFELNKYRFFINAVQKEKKNHLEKMQNDLKRAIVL